MKQIIFPINDDVRSKMKYPRVHDKYTVIELFGKYHSEIVKSVSKVISVKSLNTHNNVTLLKIFLCISMFVLSYNA